MTALRLLESISSSNDRATQLEILCRIEHLGGSIGYDTDPDTFKDFVPLLDPFDPNTWANAIRQLAQNETEPDAQALKAKLQTELDLQHSDPKLAQKKRILSILEGMESLGGSIGFQNFLLDNQTLSNGQETVSAATQAAVHTLKWPSCYATGFIRRTLLITRLDIFANSHSGSGHAWGPALGVGNLQGTLFYSSFDADNFNFSNVSAGAAATMNLKGVTTSVFVGALIGISKGFSFEGKWSW